LDRALAYADECLDLAESSKSRKNIVKGRRLRGQVLAVKGRLEEAAAEMSVALEIARNVGNPIQLWRTLESLGDLYALQDRPDDARGYYTDALKITDGIVNDLDDPSQRETYNNSAAVQALARKIGS
jgi:tetratricopeptide (TPR) repeat protein